MPIFIPVEGYETGANSWWTCLGGAENEEAGGRSKGNGNVNLHCHDGYE